MKFENHLNFNYCRDISVHVLARKKWTVSCDCLFDNGRGMFSTGLLSAKAGFRSDVAGGFSALILYPPGVCCAGGETYKGLPHLAV
jgi:hypothetical protein